MFENGYERKIINLHYNCVIIGSLKVTQHEKVKTRPIPIPFQSFIIYPKTSFAGLAVGSKLLKSEWDSRILKIVQKLERKIRSFTFFLLLNPISN